MIRNYFKTAWRTISQNPVQHGIVIGGLAAALTVVLLIMLWAKNELTYNSYHVQAERIFLLIEVDETYDESIETLPYPAYQAVQSEIPEIERVAVGVPGEYMDIVFTLNDHQFYEREVLFVDSNWLDLFDYRLIAGSFERFLNEPRVIAISESRARQYFGTETAIGQVILIDSIPTQIAAVFADVPANSSLRPHILMSQQDLQNRPNFLRDGDYWGGYMVYIFVKLHPSADPAAVSSKITPIFRKNQPYNEGTEYHHPLVRLTDIHLGGHGFSYLPQGNKNTIVIFSALAFLLLLTASVNFVNLALARMTTRHKEIGIRKVTGATKRQLFGQVMTETVLTITICAVLTVLLLIVALPFFNRYFEASLVVSLSDADTLWLVIAVFGAVVMLTGIYPALLTGHTNPLQLFRGKILGQTDNKRFRDALMVGQMVLAVVMLVGVLVIYGQFRYIQQTTAAYQMDQVFSFRRPVIGGGIRAGSQEERDYRNQLQTIKQQILEHSSVKTVTKTNGASLIDNPHKMEMGYEWIGYPKTEKNIETVMLWVDHDYPKLADVQLLSGRWFDPENKSDIKNILINETAVKAFGLKEPVIGTAYSIQGDHEGKIIGVVRDFHHASIHQPIQPLVFELDQRGMGGKYLVEAHGGRISDALAAVETIYKQHFPGKPFEYTFLDEEFDKLYKQDRKALVFSLVFAGLSLLISALGILAMAMFATQRRIKEIGIRKVLGASFASILTLLSCDFIRMVLLAIVIASPIAWFAMNRWLQDFAYRIEIQWWMFAVAGTAAVLLALITVSWQAMRVAMANPVDSLRDE